ncbi:DNA repair protein Nse1 [Penicillium atrosanguineum]|nr:DNA repair protein Nse1 [Penicillium atrosanguineum]
MDNSTYNDCNRAFLQAFMARSSMNFDEAQPVLAAIISAHEGRTVDAEDVTQELFSSYISSANTAISPFNFEIRSSLRQIAKDPNHDTTEDPPERVYALVNVHVDALTQLATTYSPDEIAFVKRVLDFMFVTNNTRIIEGMVITPIQATHLAKVSSADTNLRRSTNAESQQNQGGAAQSLTMTQAETMMQNLLVEGWLEKSQKNYFSLTPRALMELRSWLSDTYNYVKENGRKVEHIKFCAACREIITVGQRCVDRDCLGRLHDHCMHNFFRVQQAEKCPVCKEDWPGDKFVGERAVTSASRRQSNNVPRTSQLHSSAPNGRMETSDEESEEDEG